MHEHDEINSHDMLELHGALIQQVMQIFQAREQVSSSHSNFKKIINNLGLTINQTSADGRPCACYHGIYHDNQVQDMLVLYTPDVVLMDVNGHVYYIFGASRKFLVIFQNPHDACLVHIAKECSRSMLELLSIQDLGSWARHFWKYEGSNEQLCQL